VSTEIEEEGEEWVSGLGGMSEFVGRMVFDNLLSSTRHGFRNRLKCHLFKSIIVMSSIITFTYYSERNPTNGRTLSLFPEYRTVVPLFLIKSRS
jgi:hypothetical protein